MSAIHNQKPSKVSLSANSLRKVVNIMEKYINANNGRCKPNDRHQVMTPEKFTDIDISLTIIGLQSKIDEYRVMIAEHSIDNNENVIRACENAIVSCQCLLEEAQALKGGE